jgi:hypothetical protein
MMFSGQSLIYYKLRQIPLPQFCIYTQNSFSLLSLGFAGQGEAKTCTAQRAVGSLSPQVPAMRFNDRAADGQSHTGPVRLRGEERIKDLLRLLRGQPHASIADGHHDLLVSSRAPSTSFIASIAFIMRFINNCCN